MIRITSQDDLKLGYLIKTTGIEDSIKKIKWNSLLDRIVTKLNTYGDAEQIVPVLKNWYSGYRNSKEGEDIQSSGIGIAFIVQALSFFFNNYQNGQLNQEILNLRNQLLPLNPPEEQQNDNQNEDVNVDEFGNA